MKVFFGILFCIAFGAPSSSYAFNKLTVKCSAENINCPPLPSPPALPISPSAPPSPPSLPSAPVPPSPPMLQVVPEMLVPAQAYLACVGKSTGTEITWEYENKSSMTGVCVERNGKPYLKLNNVHIVQ